MRKNYVLHLNIESDAIEELKKEAESRGITMSAVCREKLRRGDTMKRIEIKLDSLIRRNGNK